MSPYLELWPVERIVYGAASATKSDAISALLDVAAKGARMSAEKRGRVLAAILEREKSGSTAVGGLAIPHAKSPDVKTAVSALGVFPNGIEFGALDGGRVHAVFLLLSPAAQAVEHVTVLRFIAGLARKPDFMRFLRRTTDPTQARSLLEELGG